MKHLHEKVSIIPFNAKADTLTPEECQQFTKQIIKEIQEHKIKIYEFPETDDEEENKRAKKIKLQQHHEQLKNNLEAQHKELEEKCHHVEDEKANWEAQQCILEQQNSSRGLRDPQSPGPEIVQCSMNGDHPGYGKAVDMRVRWGRRITRLGWVSEEQAGLSRCPWCWGKWLWASRTSKWSTGVIMYTLLAGSPTLLALEAVADAEVDHQQQLPVWLAYVG
ncbi:hypothetical protein H8959_018849 [Pygathrix nigripes]